MTLLVATCPGCKQQIDVIQQLWRVKDGNGDVTEVLGKYTLVHHRLQLDRERRICAMSSQQVLTEHVRMMVADDGVGDVLFDV